MSDRSQLCNVSNMLSQMGLLGWSGRGGRVDVVGHKEALFSLSVLQSLVGVLTFDLLNLDPSLRSARD